jgi:hypothetical protein
MIDKNAERVAEAVRRALETALPEYAAMVRDEALRDVEPSHENCFGQDDIDEARKQGLVEAMLPWQLLEVMGISRRECEMMFIGPFIGDGVMLCREDLLRHVRRMPTFAAFIEREAELLRAPVTVASGENVIGVDFAKRVKRAEVTPPPDMRELLSSPVGGIISEARPNGGQMVSVAGNGGRIVGGGGIPAADWDAPELPDLPDEPEPFQYDEPPELPPDINDGVEGLEDELDSWLRRHGSVTPPPPPKSSIQWTEEQLAALDAVDEWLERGDSFFALTGPAGSGKSTVVNEVCRRHYSAVLAAMTGKAALRLSACAERDATTLHKILYWPPKPGEDLRFTRLREPESDLIVVDEASMMSPSVFKHLQQWAHGGVRVLLVGDSFQLPPVVTGEELREYGEDYSVFRHVDGVALETVMRSAGGVLRAAKKVRETGDICRESDEGYEYVRSQTPTRDAVEAYLADPDDHMLITWRNTIRMTANKMIRERLGHKGPLPDEGEPVLLKKNGQGFMNGEIVECGSFKAGPTVGGMRTLWMTLRDGQRILVSFDGGKDGEKMDGGQPWVEDYRKYHIDLTKNALPEPIPITFGYVLTAHAGQGSEARRATVFLEREDAKNRNFRKPTTLPGGRQVSMACRWTYTATTRSKSRTTMIVGR